MIECKCFKFCINGVNLTLLKTELYVENNLLPVKKKVKGSTLGWYVNRKFISYNQIKKL